MGIVWYTPPALYLFYLCPLGASCNHSLSRAVRSICFVLPSSSCLGKDSRRCYRQAPPPIPFVTSRSINFTVLSSHPSCTNSRGLTREPRSGLSYQDHVPRGKLVSFALLQYCYETTFGHLIHCSERSPSVFSFPLTSFYHLPSTDLTQTPWSLTTRGQDTDKYHIQ